MELNMPWLERSDRPAMRAWAQLEVLADMAHIHLRKEGILNSKGEPRMLLDVFRKLRLAQLQFVVIW
jgi:hypothetical protein